jgi:LacI family transcriptional regulator, galactose operon repressor
VKGQESLQRVAKLTMKKIAADLGVSITTVSKVLNDAPDIGLATRGRVLAYIEQHGYRPNAVARSLTLQRTATFGVVIPDLMHSFFVEIFAAMDEVVAPRGYRLLFSNSGENAAKERTDLEALIERQVDGLVVAPADATANEDQLRRIVQRGTPLVMVDRDDHPAIRCHRVLTDDMAVGCLATEHLIGLGHQFIGHLAGPGIAHARRRFEGYRSALLAHGIPFRQSLVVGDSFLEADGYRAMCELLDRTPRPTAVFAANDPTAIGAMKAVLASGLSVPEDIALVGAGDIAHGDLLRVPLTTVSWSRHEIGTRAAELLLAQLADPQMAPERVVVPPSLLVRGSCGPILSPCVSRRSTSPTS